MEEKDKKHEYKNYLEESFEDLYENAPCGYFSSLPDGTIVKINNTLALWLGYQKNEIILKKKFQEFLNIGGKIFYETHHAPLIRMQGSINEINYDLISKDGSSFPVLINSFHITNAEGTVMLYRSTVVNIKDRKKYELELLHAKKKAEQAAKVKAEFLSTVSHEIRTPMNAIIGVSNLLLETNPTPGQLEYLKILKLSSENLLNLINDILDFNKIESGKVMLEEKTINIRDFLYTIVYNYHVKAEEKGLTLNSRIDNNLPEYLIGDPVKINQILTNLIGNAIKFTDEGAVTVELKAGEITEHDVLVIFTVTDTGIGIAPDKIHKIFEEFTQADYEINLKYGGTGLGLAISKKLLALYNSTLHVDSELNKGSKFSFSLKLKISKEVVESTLLKEKSFENVPLRHVKLLVAEDNTVNIFILSQYFKSWELDFDVAENGNIAVEKIISNDYDLVLMDLQMPELNGYDAAKMIRNMPEEKYQKLPIVALSASSKFDLKHRLEYAGINDFISKPFDPKDLYSKIAFYGENSPRIRIRQVVPQQEKEAIQQEKTHTEIVLPIEDTSTFNLNHYKKLTKNDPSQLAMLIQLSIENFISFREDFEKALLSRDTALFEDVAHKSKMTIHSLEAKRLLSFIEHAKALLAADEDAEKIEAVCRDIVNEISSITTALQNSNPPYLN